MSETVLLLGGMANNARLWTTVIPHLHAAAVEVPDYGLCRSIESMSDVAIAAAGSDAIAVVGFSMGGYVAQDMLRRWPDRIARFALIGTRAGRADDATVSIMAKTAAAAEKNFEVVLERMLPGAVHPTRVADPAVSSAVMSMFREVGATAFANQCHAVAHRSDDRPTLASYRGPALIACGLEDQVCPPSLSQELSRLLPHATVRWFEECGHLAPIERPEEVTGALNDWLAGAGT